MDKLDREQILYNADIQLSSVQRENIKKQTTYIGYLGEYQPTGNLTLIKMAGDLFDRFNIEGDDSDTLGVSRPAQYIDNFPTPSGDNLTIRGQFHDTGKPYAVAYQNPDNPKEIFIVKGQTQEVVGSIGLDFGPTFVPDATPLVWSDSNPLPDEYHGLPIVVAFTDHPRKNEQPLSTAEAPAASEIAAIPHEHHQILNLIDKINNPDTTKEELEDALYELRAQLLPNERLGLPKSLKNIFDEIPLPDNSPKHPTKARSAGLTTRIIGEDSNNNVTIYQELVLAVMNGNLVLLESNSENTTPRPLQEIPDFSSAGRWQYEQLPYLMNKLKTTSHTLLVGHITK